MTVVLESAELYTLTVNMLMHKLSLRYFTFIKFDLANTARDRPARQDEKG
ncbi:MAG: hypothetical protein IKT30_08645 [Bacteroidaceae bacterium]|nr:hypothetical protein [Bacteroidaceae bacterium]